LGGRLQLSDNGCVAAAADDERNLNRAPFQLND
jgi:hypothetical protein